MIPRLWLVTDRRLTVDLAEAVRRALAVVDARDCAVLVREKDLPVRELHALCAELRAITRDAGARLVVSGRLDVALAAVADGVHLGYEAPTVEAVRRVTPDGLLVGTSLHGDERPPPGAAYAFLSPVFATTSKPGAKPLGLEGLRGGAGAADVPVIALGGIDASNAAACLRAGAAGVAVRSAWIDADDTSLRALRRALEPDEPGATVAAQRTRH